MVGGFEYDKIADFSEGLAKVQKNGKWGYMDTSGELVIDFEYDYARNFFEGLAWVQKGQKLGYINKSGEWVKS